MGNRLQRPREARDIWERIRAGYHLQDQIGTHPRIERQRFGLASRPASIQQIAERSGPYIHYIVERLEENDMPLELALLPMIESSYNPLAYSPAQAAGLWQFIPSTGRHFNLRQTNWYDGRRDITASTNAAISYLKRLHDMFNGDWLLAAGRLQRRRRHGQPRHRAQPSQGLPTDYWNLPLPQGNPGLRAQAAGRVADHPGAGQPMACSLAPIANEPYFEKVAIAHQLDLSRMADLADMDEDELFAAQSGLQAAASPSTAQAPAGAGGQGRGTERQPGPPAAEQPGAMAALPGAQRRQPARHRQPPPCHGRHPARHQPPSANRVRVGQSC